MAVCLFIVINSACMSKWQRVVRSVDKDLSINIIFRFKLRVGLGAFLRFSGQTVVGLEVLAS